MDHNIQKIAIWRWRPSTMALLALITILWVSIFPTAVSLTLLFRSMNFAFFTSTMPELGSIWRFTILEAGASAGICCLLAPILALGIRAMPSFAQGMIRPFLLAPFCLPTTVVGAAFVLTLGQSGLLNKGLISMGIVTEPWTVLYHPWTIVLPNVWMNLSLGAAIVLSAMESIPSNLWQTAELYNFSWRIKLAQLIWPAIRLPLLIWTAVTFLICLGSFGVLLVMGSSPSSTTLEYAIYQAIYYEGAFDKAACFAFAQIATAVLTLVILRYVLPRIRLAPRSVSMNSSAPNLNVPVGIKIIVYLATFAVFVCYVLPYTALIIDVIAWMRTPEFHFLNFLNTLAMPTWISLRNAAAAMFFAVFLCVIVVPTSVRADLLHSKKWLMAFGLISILPVIVPSMVQSFGIMGLNTLIPALSVGEQGIWLLQAISFLPMLTAIYMVGWRNNVLPYDHANRLLGMSEMKSLGLIELRANRLWITIVAALSLNLSMSETTISAMLSDPTAVPLTVTIHRLMASYQFGAAAAVGLILMFASTISSYLIWKFRGNHDA